MRRKLSDTSISRWIGLVVITAVYFFVYFHRVSTSVLASDLVATIGISSTALGLLASAYFYTYTILQPVAGILVDRWKPRRVITIFGLVMGLGSITFALAPNFWIAFVARIAIGIGAGGIWIPATWFISRRFDPGKRAFIFSLLMVGGNTGAIVAAGPFGVLSVMMGWRNAMLILATAVLIFAALTWITVRDKPEEVSFSRKKDNSFRAIPSENLSGKRGWFSIMRVTFGNRIVRYAACTAFLGYGALMSFQGLWGIPYLMDTYGLSKISASNMIMMLPIGFVVGLLILGRALDTRFGGLITIMGYGASAAIYFIFFIATDGLTPFSLSLCIFSIGFSHSVFPYLIKIYTEILPFSTFGTALGICNIFPFLGGVVFPPLTGYIFDLFGAGALHHPIVAYKYFFLLLTVVVVIATIAVSQVRMPNKENSL